MLVEQIYTGCLSQGSYYIISNGEGIIIDPLREVQPYLDRAKRDGVVIKYILETHFHADFVSGHLDLAKETGAKIVYGPNANPTFDFYSAKDGEVFNFGNVSFKVLHTPGHTLESTCYLLLDENGKEHALFSGDTLFIGDVGRPDLVQKAASMTMDDLAGMLFHSLRDKVMTLPDDVIVYPAHGAGSACGKNLSKETVSTIGEQKRNNYALRADMTEADFIKEVTDGLLPPPGYFGMNVAMNKSGYDSISEVMKRGLTPLDLDAFELISENKEVLILDTRNASEFAGGFIKRSLFVGLEGQFAPWVGAMIPNVNQKIVLVTEEGKEEETVKRLARVGYDHVLGYLKGGFETWLSSGNSFEKIDRIDADEFAKEMENSPLVIDVRKPDEFEAEHVIYAESIPLDHINENLNKFPNKLFILHCAGGYRSMIAASVLKMHGISDFADVIGGFSAISKTSVKTSQFQCSSKGG
ncbi:MAG: MBL fold metallo-hydrolase [Bacteroidetes bacterium]|nr:MBL fold metallo-hydrolase [Bacteroidota bacterium]